MLSFIYKLFKLKGPPKPLFAWLLIGQQGMNTIFKMCVGGLGMSFDP